MAKKKLEDMTWAEQQEALYDEITARPGFRYDPAEDPLYQSAKDQYVAQGRRAMEDTMGQAAGLTGGYASSYGQSVGNQAFNEHLTKLNAQIPALASQARENYDAETASLYNQLSYAQGMADQEYNRAWNEQQYADQMAYQAWQQKQTERTNAYNWALQLLSTGQIPSQDVLQQAGISDADARSYANYYAKLAAGSGTGGGGGGGYYTEAPQGTTQPRQDYGEPVMIKGNTRNELLKYATSHNKAEFDAYFRQNYGNALNAEEIYNWIRQQILNQGGKNTGTSAGGGGGIRYATTK